MDAKVILMDDTNKQKLVGGLYNAIGDDLLECMKLTELPDKYSNSEKFLKWDLINKNFIKSFRGSNILAEYANRGPWYMVPLVDIQNGVIYSVLREDRFKELQRKREKRKKAHYIDAFIQMFNFDLTKYQQMSLFDESFPDEEVRNIVVSVLEALNVVSGIIKRHAVILFEEYNHELIGVRCCIIDANLDVIEEENWNAFIKHDYSVITETVSYDEIEEEKKVKPTLGKRARIKKEKKIGISSKRTFQENMN